MLHEKSKRSLGQVYLLLVSIGALAIVSIFAAVIILTMRIDAQARSNALTKLSVVLAEMQTALQLSTEDYAYWTVAYDLIVANDAEGIYYNVGSGAAESDLFDWLVITSPQGDILHSYGIPPNGDPPVFLPADSIAAILSQLNEHDPEDYVSVTGHVGLDDAVVLATAAFVTPAELTGLRGENLPVMIGGKSYSPARLVDLGSRVGADDLTVLSGSMIADENILTLGGAFGTPARIALVPQQPGMKILRDAIPIILAICLPIGLIALTVARRFGALLNRLKEAIALASTDALTGLSNRAALRDLLLSSPVYQAVSGGEFALISVDLNRFKELNDRRGHGAGDRALKITADRLNGAVRAHDHVIRTGGDEFLCLIIDPNPGPAATCVARRIAELCNEPIDFGDFVDVLPASVGVAVSKDGSDWELLLQQSDAAMYFAKRWQSKQPAIWDIMRARPTFQ